MTPRFMKVLLLVVEFFPLLLNSDIFLNFPTVVSKSMYENKGKRKQHTLKWMQKKSMAIPEAILELQNGALRESALRCLSNFLLEKREADPEKYNTTGYMLYFSCSTVALLLQNLETGSVGVPQIDERFQEFLLTIMIRETFPQFSIYFKIVIKRLIQSCFLQCIAANAEARQKVVDCKICYSSFASFLGFGSQLSVYGSQTLIPNYIIPIMMFKTSFDGFENVRAVALSVFGILCQGREPHIIKWALENEVPEASQVALEIGNELSRVFGDLENCIEVVLLKYLFYTPRTTEIEFRYRSPITGSKAIWFIRVKFKPFISKNMIAMHIFEAILRNDLGISYICSPYNNRLLGNMMRTWNLMTFPKIKHLVEQLQFTVGNWYN
ncbi:hypothetical protein M9H77_06626 [Catharanthus roseus]|uniref:Uncharacterized protein n=1 Tax=Catharanthus roseus TaxID=4058 RepID=A0ACC0BSL7_CATRO|nr:hypothetical protein M9H77_06626 [Catharanthus roseus]